MKYFKKIDFIGSSLSLYVSQQTIYQTGLGAFISILVSIATAGAAFYFGMEIWERKNPVVNRAIEVTPFPDPLLLDKEKWDFFFGLQYNNVLYVDPSIYTVRARMFTFKNSTGLTFKHYNIEPCTLDSFSNSTKEIFSAYNYKGAQCISKDQNMTLQLNRLWGQENFSYLEVSLWPCKNSTALGGVTCSPQEKIDKWLNSATFSVFTIVYYIQTKDYENPYIPAIFNDFYPVLIKSFTQSIIFLAHSETQSDAGWLIQDNKIDKRFFLDRAKLNFYTQPELDGRFLRFQYQLSNLKEINTRKYLKLQELAAQIGGIAKFLMICGVVVNYFFAEFFLKEYLVNLYFDSNLDETLNYAATFKQLTNNVNQINKIQEESKKNNTQTSQLKGVNNSDNKLNINSVSKYGMLDLIKKRKVEAEDNNQSSNQVSQNVNIPSHLHLPRRRKLEFSIFEVMFNCLFTAKTNRDNIKILKNGFKLLRNYLSIENFLEVTRTLSKLRFFLLSPYENDIFDKIGNPTFGESNKNTINNNYFSRMSSFVNQHNIKVNDSIVIEYQSENSQIQEELRSNKTLNKLIQTYNSRPYSIKPSPKELMLCERKVFEY